MNGTLEQEKVLEVGKKYNLYTREFSGENVFAGNRGEFLAFISVVEIRGRKEIDIIKTLEAKVNEGSVFIGGCYVLEYAFIDDNPQEYERLHKIWETAQARATN
ncbi:MAG: hypothetical protein Q8N88_04045 [Nanoarchaeota archaeon]|nr:hypothetical protein [Nanoarchaeota archaeon]